MAATILTPEEIDALEPVYLGVTWRRNDDGSWLLPERTLGWQIAGWTAKYLRNPNGQGPWKFTKEQLRFILWWYAVDESGRFVYRTGVLQRLKGWGKDPLLAVMCLVELLGPSRVKRVCGEVEWGPDGNPVGEAHPAAWVQVAAVSRDQTRNTMTMFPALMSDLLISTYGVKPGSELIRAHNGRVRLEAVTSNYRTLEGGRSTFVVLNETHHWVKGNKGDLMYETVDGNATKMDGRYLAITNAYLPGEDSVAEKMRESYEEILDGRAMDVGFLYDSVEADPRTPLTPEALRIVIPKIRGDAVWLKIEAIIQSVLNKTISPSRSRRMWLNQIVADEESLYGLDQLKAIEADDEDLMPGEEIVLGFDGGKTDDDTALVAIRTSDSTAFVLGHWYRPSGQEGEDWEIDKTLVDSKVHEVFSTYEVAGFYADVALWESYVAGWAEAYGEGLRVKAPGTNACAWDMRKGLKFITLAHERLMQSVFDAKVRVGELDERGRSLIRHMQNARRRENVHGISFGKESKDSPRKVDLYAALLLAHECLYDLRTRGKKPQETGSVRSWFV